MTIPKRILAAAVAGVWLVVGVVGAVAQTIDETVEWLEYYCGEHGVVDRNRDVVHYSCKLQDDGHMLVATRWSGSPREIRRYFDIQDVEIGVEDGENTGLGVSFSCEDGSGCIAYFGEDGEPNRREWTMIAIVNYEPSGRYTEHAEEKAASLARGFLHYRKLAEESSKEMMF